MSTWIIGGIIFIVMGLIIIKLYRDKKLGKTSCGYSCKECPNSKYCHSKK